MMAAKGKALPVLLLKYFGSSIAIATWNSFVLHNDQLTMSDYNSKMLRVSICLIA